MELDLFAGLTHGQMEGRALGRAVVGLKSFSEFVDG